MVSATSSMLATNIRDYQVTYGNRLFNHLSISLSALTYLDASEEQIISFYSHYIDRLSIREPQRQTYDPIAQQSAVLLEYYRTSLSEIGIEQTLKAELATLMPGIIAGGFYALNRLASAISLKDIDEIATSLTYWRVYYLELGEITSSLDMPPTKILRQLIKVIGHFRFPAGNTCDRVKSVSTLYDYQNSDNQPHEISLEIIADATVKIYQMTGDFTMLHALTATASLKVILPYCEEQELALRYFWQAVVVAYLSTGGAPMSSVEQSPLLPWAEIFSFCHQSPNEHLIELCRACHQLDELLTHQRCHQVASRQVFLNR